jgi:hypothetical protein
VESDTKSYLEIEGGTKMSCEFNPNELVVSRSNTWEAAPKAGRGVPKVRFGGSNSGTFKLELFFDTTDTGKPVTSYTGKIQKLMDIKPDLPGSDPDSGKARPPWVRFHWGDLHSFRAVVTDMSISFIYFAATGVPLRARVSLNLLQYKEELAFGPQNPTSGTPRPHRVHRVRPGETLDRIAAAHYGDSTRWRNIAAANGVEDPFALRPGALLSIPRLD